MKFVNTTGEDVMLPMPNKSRDLAPEWKTIAKGETVELEENVGLALKFSVSQEEYSDSEKDKKGAVSTEESKLGEQVVETKKIKGESPKSKKAPTDKKK